MLSFDCYLSTNKPNVLFFEGPNYCKRFKLNHAIFELICLQCPTCISYCFFAVIVSIGLKKTELLDLLKKNPLQSQADNSFVVKKVVALA